ncbi:MAG: hypothetical protein N2747_00010 [Chitinophagaceae bacterium]|nr:hypothetical protein [Chitinophagaceae bacterium]
MPVLTISGDLCKLPLVVGSSIKCPPGCQSADSVFVYNNITSALVLSGPSPLSISGLANGTYTIVWNGYCNGQLCLTCKMLLRVDCKEEECNCRGSSWGEISLGPPGGGVPMDKIVVPANPPVGQILKCGNTYPLKCNQPVTVNANYNCPDPANCPPKVTYSLQPPGGPALTGNAPITFTPNQTGTYTLTLYGWCGNKICDSCKVIFKTECPKPDSTCCPYKITVNTTGSNMSYNTGWNASVLTQQFSISGLAGVPITEVRVEVVSYTITDNYNKECMRCVNLPFTWASAQSATNLGNPSVSPAITLFNTSVHPFNPTGAGQYKNPREVVWSSSNPFQISNGSMVSISYLLPPPPGIDCCELKGRICVKFIFRDKECKECEVINCFDFLIKKK